MEHTSTMTDTILYEVDNGVATITLNRPERYNAFIDEMNFALTKAFKAAKKDESVRVVVLTGAGEKAFCSGQDVKAVKDQVGERNLGDSVRKRYNPMIKAMRSMEKPIICRLNGVAAGAGCSIVLACDLIVAADHAKLMEVFVNIGLVLDSGSSFFLPRMVGSHRAFEMCTMGTKVTAQEAKDWGIVSQVVPLAELDEAVEKYTDYYKNAPTKAIGMIKKMINHSFQSDLDTMLELEAQYQEVAGNSEDHKEGVTAFNEKRKPVFKGK